MHFFRGQRALHPEGGRGEIDYDWDALPREMDLVLMHLEGCLECCLCVREFMWAHKEQS